jgi:hypothetical protein
VSIHRTDRPNAPYRIRRSNLGHKRWMWIHREGNRWCAGDRDYQTREQASAAAAVHATSEHGASLDHLRTLMPALRNMGVLAANGEPRKPIGSRNVYLTGQEDVPRKDQFTLTPAEEVVPITD